MNNHIKSSSDLVTTQEARRSGFLEIALRKNIEALPYIDEAKALKAIADGYSKPEDLAKDPLVKGPLAIAAGVSTKASNYLDNTDIDTIVLEFIKNFLKPAGAQFREELVYRFLLTKGDALGGRMRNIVGGIAAEKLTRFLTASLRNSMLSHHLLIDNIWHDSQNVTHDNLISVKAIKWINLKNKNRTIIYNLKVPVVDKNIDISVFNGDANFNSRGIPSRPFIVEPKNYLALGELKGGIDPAGADEHWKTANTALQRIRKSFIASNIPVKTFFVAGAIEVSMATEIYNQVSSKELSTAANLNNENQLAELCGWLVSL
jgi:hypothetical protein